LGEKFKKVAILKNVSYLFEGLWMKNRIKLFFLQLSGLNFGKN